MGRDPNSSDDKDQRDSVDRMDDAAKRFDDVTSRPHTPADHGQALQDARDAADQALKDQLDPNKP